jgi:hypothetical protein
MGSRKKGGGGILAKFAVHNPDVAWRIVDGEAAVVTPGDGMLHILNEVGTAVWRSVEKPARLSSVVGAILEQFDVTRAVAEADVAEFAADLEARHMLMIKSSLKGLSARTDRP